MMPLAGPDPLDASRWVDISLAQNPTLVASRLGADVARENVRSAIGGHLPTLDLVAGRSYTEGNSDQVLQGEAFSGVNNKFNDRQIGLQLTVPIFSTLALPVRITRDWPKRSGIAITVSGFAMRFSTVLPGSCRGSMTITGPGGYRHYFAHLEEYGPQAIGDWVEAGEIIGYAGNSGNAAISSTHLHYGIYTPGGEAVNPYKYLHGGAPFAMRAAMQTAAK